MAVVNLSPAELAVWIADPERQAPLLLDVREAWEYEHCHIAGSVHLPMAAVPLRIDELDAESATVVICHHGARSAQTAYFLHHSGFTRIYNLNGGIDAWSQTVDSSLRRY